MIKSKEEKTKLNSIKEKLKTNVYKTYILFHDEFAISKTFAIFLMVTSFLNLFCFILNEESGAISFAENDIEQIRIFQRIFSFAYHVEAVEQNIEIAVSFLFVIGIIFIGIFIVLVFLANSNKHSGVKKNIQLIFAYYSYIMYWIMVCPIAKISFTVLFHPTKYSVNNIILTVFNLVIMLIFTTFHSFFGHKSFYKYINPDALARVDSNFEIYYLIYRILLILMLTITYVYQVPFWLYFSLIFVCACIFIKFNWNILLYYDHCISKIFNFFLFQQLLLVMIIILINAVADMDIFYLTAATTILLIPFSNSFVDRKMQNLLNVNSFEEFNNDPIKVEKFLKTINFIINEENEQNSENLMMFYGLLENQNKEYETIFTKKSFYIPNINEFIRKNDIDTLSKKMSLYFLFSTYKYFIDTGNVSNNIPLLISYCNFQNEEMGNFVELFKYIAQIISEEVTKTIQQDFAIYRISIIALKKINKETEMEISDETNSIILDLKSVIEYYDLISELKIKITEVGNLSYHFWNQLTIAIIDINDFDAKGQEIYRFNTEIEEIYNKLVSLYANNNEINVRLNDFLLYIQGDPNLAIKMTKRKKEAEENINKSFEKLNNFKNLFFSNDSAMVIASFNNETVSSIEKASDSIINNFGYLPQYLLGKPLETLMPEFYASRHKDYVGFHMSTGINRLIKKDNILYGKSNTGTIFPIRILMTALPTINHSLLYLAIFKKLDDNYGLILANSYGRVQNINEIMKKKIKVNPESLEENPFYIYFLLTSLIGKCQDGYITCLELENFNLEESSEKLMMICTSNETINSFRKLVSNKDDKRYLHEYIAELKKSTTKYNFFLHWKNYTVSIEKLIYNNKENIEQNSIFAIKIFYEMENDESFKLDKKNQNLHQLAIERANNKVVKKLKELNNDNHDNNALSGIMNIMEGERIARKDAKKTKTQKRKINILEKMKGQQISVQSSLDSLFESQKYHRHSVLKSKIKKLLKLDHRTNKTISIIGYILLFFSIGFYLFMSVYSIIKIDDIKNGLKEQINNLGLYPNINCLQMNLYSIILEKVLNNNTTNFDLTLSNCVQNLSFQINFIDKIQIVESVIALDLGLEMEKTQVEKFNTMLNNDLNKYPFLEYINYISYKIIREQFDTNTLSSHSSLSSSSSRTHDRFNTSNLFYNHLQNNFFNIIQDKFESNNSNTIIYLDYIVNFQTYTRIFLILLISLIAIILSFLVPIISLKKRKQTFMLESFIAIRKFDIQKLYINPLQKYLGSSISIKNQKIQNVELKEEDEVEKEKDNDKDSDKKKDEKESHKKHKKDKESKGDKDSKDSNSNDSKENDEKDKDSKSKKGKKKDKSKKNKKESKKDLLMLNKSYLNFFFKVVLCGLGMLIYFALVPIINYIYKENFYNNSILIYNSRATINEYSFYLIRSFIKTKQIFLDSVNNNGTINEQSIQQYTNMTLKLKDLKYNFSSIINNNYDFYGINDFKDLFNDNICNVFKKYGYADADCITFVNSHKLNGLNAIISVMIDKLSIIYQKIISFGNFISRDDVVNLLMSEEYNQIEEINSVILQQSFKVIDEIYYKSLQFSYDDNYTINYTLIIIYLLLVIINIFVIWVKINNMIQELTDNNFKLYLNLPFILLNRDNTELSESIKNINEEIEEYNINID